MNKRGISRVFRLGGIVEGVLSSPVLGGTRKLRPERVSDLATATQRIGG